LAIFFISGSGDARGTFGAASGFSRRLKVPSFSKDPFNRRKKMAKVQLFNTYTFAGEHYRSVKRPRYVIFNITHVQRLVENIDNN
jgi:hypothetical protein